MPKYALLLKGINVGGKKKVAMADLRDLLGALGYTEVKTHLQSGNAVFATTAKPAGLAAAIEAKLSADLGMSISCLIRTGAELQKVIDDNPLAKFAETNGSRFMAHFLSAKPDAKLLAEFDPVALDPEHVRIGDRVIYQWCPDGLLEAPAIAPFVEKKLKVIVSARNWNTVVKLAELAQG